MEKHLHIPKRSAAAPCSNIPAIETSITPPPIKALTYLEKFFFFEKREIQWLDGLRAIAILLVIARHVFDRPFANLYGIQAIESNSSNLNILASYGWSGVGLFFIISGFLVGGGLVLSIKNSQFYWGHFIIGRFFRIFMPAAVMLLICCQINHKTGQSIVDNFLLITNYTQDGWLPHFWSLCVEEHFYIIAPLCGILASRAIAKLDLNLLAHIFLIIGLFLSATRLMMPYFIEIPARNYYVQSHWLFDFFIVGIALRLYWESRNLNSKTTITNGVTFFCLSWIAGYVLVATCSLAARNNSLLGNIGSGVDECRVLTLTLFLMGSLFYAYRFKVFAEILSCKLLRFIAAISFSTYLVHIPIIELGADIFQAVGKAFENSPELCLVSMLITGIVGSLVMGLVFFVLIERPIMVFRNHFLSLQLRGEHSR